MDRAEVSARTQIGRWSPLPRAQTYRRALAWRTPGLAAARAQITEGAGVANARVSAPLG